MISALTYQNLITVELVADATELNPAPTLFQVQDWWPEFGFAGTFDPDIALVGPHLQYLYVKRKGVESMLGSAWQDTGATVAEEQLSSNSISANLAALHKLLTAEIDKIMSRARASRPSVIATITTTAPIDPLDPTRPDPNSSYFYGDPLKPGVMGRL